MSTRLIALSILILAAGVANAAQIDIDQAGQQFSKKAATVKVGDKIVYRNSDDAIHNINVIDAADLAIDKGLQKPGETIEILFDKAGKFTVRCSIHPKMKMTVSVD